MPFPSAARRYSLAIAGATPRVIAASLALIPVSNASGFIIKDLILPNTYTRKKSQDSTDKIKYKYFSFYISVGDRLMLRSCKLSYSC